ncbi:MAG: SH3 domain-containing protein [Planctomycetota bacterium]
MTANDVYVRSGDSLNHYPICKLNAGDRLTVVAERGEWYEVLPPDGTFSLVSGDYVDTTDGQSGTINGDNVRVRAGSLLNENKYTVQTMLTKGDVVQVLGRNPDGFLKIKPPRGATVWINKQFVSIEGAVKAKDSRDAPVASATPGTKPEPVSPADPPRADSPGSGVLAMPTLKKSPSASSPVSPLWWKRFEEADEALRAELERSPAEQNIVVAVDRFRPIAEQNEDGYAKEYAEARLAEMKNRVDLADAIQAVRRLGDDADAKRIEFMNNRAGIPHPTVPVPAGIHIQGELRTSALYPPGSSTVRYRLIDPTTSEGRTVGYVEIPGDTSIRVEEFLGRYVGVRASKSRLQPDSIDPVPIYVADELVPLEAPSATTPTGGEK